MLEHNEWTFVDGVWIIRNEMLEVRIDAATFEAHAQAYLVSQGSDPRSYSERLEELLQVEQQHYQAQQTLCTLAYWLPVIDAQISLRGKKEDMGKEKRAAQSSNTDPKTAAAPSQDTTVPRVLQGMPVEAIIAQILEIQARCLLFQDELSIRARLHDMTTRQWVNFATVVRGLLDYLQALQASEVIDEGWLTQRDTYIRHLERYIDESFPTKDMP